MLSEACADEINIFDASMRIVVMATTVKISPVSVLFTSYSEVMSVFLNDVSIEKEAASFAKRKEHIMKDA